jgi:hypothetical protein
MRAAIWHTVHPLLLSSSSSSALGGIVDGIGGADARTDRRAITTSRTPGARQWTWHVRVATTQGPPLPSPCRPSPSSKRLGCWAIAGDDGVRVGVGVASSESSSAMSFRQ